MARKPLPTVKYDVGTAIDNARQEIEDLAGEMREWAENLESGNLDHTEKAQRVSEAADALEALDVPEPDDEFQITDTLKLELSAEQMTFDFTPMKRKRGYLSRRNRAAEAANLLESAAGAIRNHIENDYSDADDDDLDFSALEQLADELESVASELQDVEFPGMYG